MISHEDTNTKKLTSLEHELNSIQNCLGGYNEIFGKINTQISDLKVI